MHADGSDTRAAIEALGNLKLAVLTDDFEPGEGHDVRGFMVDPRGNGRVAVYWVFGGDIRERDGEPFKVELQIAADKFREAGWTVERRSVFCVFAHRPAPVIPVPESEWTQFPVQVKAGDLIEAKTATRNSEPSTIRRRVNREPWLIGRNSAAISDGKGLDSVFTDTIRVIDETPQRPDVRGDAAERRRSQRRARRRRGPAAGPGAPARPDLVRHPVAQGRRGVVRERRHLRPG
ncbi:hypothetical protein ACFQ3Z_16230 [Streptomyces nogalater]